MVSEMRGGSQTRPQFYAQRDVLLFAQRDVLRDAQITRTQNDSSGGARAATRRKILIVEDNLILAMALEDALDDEGYEVVGVAVDADEAATMAQNCRPDLAVMDIRLAGSRDGIDAAIQLREKYGIRSLFASAHSAPDMRQRAIAAQPVGWVTKPYSPTELVRAIKRALDEAS